MTIDLEKLKALLEKATPGLWKQGSEESAKQGHVIRAKGNGPDSIVTCQEIFMDREQRLSNADLIVAAVNSLPELIQELEKSRIAMKELERMDTRIGLPPMYEPREMDAFRNGWNSNDDRWQRQRDAILKKWKE